MSECSGGGLTRGQWLLTLFFFPYSSGHTEHYYSAFEHQAWQNSKPQRDFCSCDSTLTNCTRSRNKATMTYFLLVWSLPDKCGERWYFLLGHISQVLQHYWQLVTHQAFGHECEPWCSLYFCFDDEHEISESVLLSKDLLVCKYWVHNVFQSSIILHGD